MKNKISSKSNVLQKKVQPFLPTLFKFMHTKGKPFFSAITQVINIISTKDGVNTNNKERHIYYKKDSTISNYIL